jgi:hypothetical protein
MDAVAFVLVEPDDSVEIGLRAVVELEFGAADGDGREAEEGVGAGINGVAAPADTDLRQPVAGFNQVVVALNADRIVARAASDRGFVAVTAAS